MTVVEFSWTSLGAYSRFGVGAVKNINGDAPVYDVVVEVELRNSFGTLMGTKEATTTLTATLPGQLNPFSAYLTLSN